ncbi:hypothetical protein K6X12_06355 [Xanthomonas euvesicatoria pv. allii]|uniref:hypothetical protein n=1 Tax=Xanthomonas euvesicatoria TaxID=456327 RepID=UPI00240505A9|nr:hypothetical protein [Xanthomonas euvesicatoria]MCP3050718.1 hypothetical protein [Xanthomonas euvesicatoria pv. allii]
MSEPFGVDDFSAAMAALRSQPRYTLEQIASGAARRLVIAEIAQLEGLAGAMPDLMAMLEQWVSSGLPLTDHDFKVMLQAHGYWRRFSDGIYKRAIERPF